MSPEQLSQMAADIMSGSNVSAKDAVRKAREIVAEVAKDVTAESGELRLREETAAGKADAKRERQD